MNQIIIVTKYEFIAKNIEDFLQIYFKLPFVWVSNFQSIDTTLLDDEDLVIIVNDDNSSSYESKSIKAKMIVLTPFKSKNSFNEEDMSVLSFPVFLPSLLEAIQNKTKIKTSNSQSFNIEEFKLILDYGEIVLENKKLNQQIHITETEGKILQKLFMSYPNSINRKSLLIANWEDSENCPLEIHLSNIKKKLLECKFNLNIIKNTDSYKLEVTKVN